MSCCIAWLGCGCGDPSGPKTTITSYKDRSCTDIPCLGLFVAVMCMMNVMIWTPAFEQGNYQWDAPNRLLLLPHDYNHQLCGVGEFQGKPFAFWPDIEFALHDHIWYHKSFLLCTESCDVTLNGTLMTKPYRSTNEFGYCVPDPADLLSKGLSTIQVQAIKQMRTSYVKDIIKAKWIILISIGIALAIAFVYIFLMKTFIAPLVYCSIICIIAALGAISYLLLQHSETFENDDDAKPWKYSSYAVAGIDALFFMMICCFGNRIKMAVEVVKSSSRAFEDVPGIPFFPICSVIIHILFLMVWGYVALYIFATSGLEEREIPAWISGKRYPGYAVFSPGNYRKLDYSGTVETAFLPHFFVLLWVSAAIHYFTFVIVAGVVADWYFTPRDPKSGKKLRCNKYSKQYIDEIHLTSTPICDAIWRTLRHHIGTIVFAALIIAVVRFIRACVLYTVKVLDGGQCPNKVNLCFQG
eukprot:32521_1